MKSSLIILAFFVLGCLSGLYFTADFDIHEASVGVLYILMLLLGINLGCNQDIKGFAKMINFKMLLVPVATVTGTFLFSAIAGFILSQWSVFDCMAVGSGFAYYSISSVLITQLKTPSIGMQAGHRIGDYCFACQYLPRNDCFDRSSFHPEILRASCPYLGSWYRFFRYFVGFYFKILRTRSYPISYFTRNLNKYQRTFLCIAVL